MSVQTPAFSSIWQGTANEIAIRALLRADSPAVKMSITGVETIRVRDAALMLGKPLGRDPVFTGEEASTMLLSNALKLLRLSALSPFPMKRSSSGRRNGSWMEAARSGSQHILNSERGILMNRHKVALDILRRGTVIPVTPLALDADRKLDTRRQRALMRYYLDAGAGGIATTVHTTQFAIREPEYGLFEPVVKLVSEEIDQFEEASGKVIIRVVGVCGAMEQTLKEVELARRLGYDAVLLSPGNLSALSEEFTLQRTH